MTDLLCDLVDRAAERAPEAEAFCSPTERLTYEELAGASDRLALLLEEEGVRRGDRVGVFLPRCLESAISVYGIMKAGAAYVPIDPHMPTGGLRQLIEDCGLRHLITSKSQAVAVKGLPPDTLECTIGPQAATGASARLRSFSELSEYPLAKRPSPGVAADDLAYIMYSSGSTGRPKGIMHTHSSGLAYARLSVATYDVRPEDRIGNHSPLHFDMSTFGYFSGPLAGAATLIIPEAYTKLAASLSQLIESQRLSIWYSVPLALIQLLTRGVLDQRDLSSLRWVLFGGEPFPPKHLYALMERWPHARFSNVYGPAEVNQCTFFHLPPLGGDHEEHSGTLQPIPIGEIWDETEGLVLGENDNISEDGPGELVIHSPTMMRGYWGRPDLDERAFYTVPGDGDSERVYYRTGDLVRRDSDGQLLFLGRKDRQLKVRGYRVELDDIEHTLALHPSVEEAAAFPVRIAEEVQHIAAAVTQKADADTEPGELLEYLAGVLSWYAVPKTIEIVTSFPRTTSGKIDRRRLQALAEAPTPES